MPEDFSNMMQEEEESVEVMKSDIMSDKFLSYDEREQALEAISSLAAE